MAIELREDQAVRAERFLRLLAIAVSAFVMLLFLVTALRRLRYPYELEKLEGYVFLTALRAFHGVTVYPRPSLEFMPYMYPPGYYYVSAALGKLMGMTIATMRMTSILSTLGCFGAIAALVWGETRRWLPAIAAAGLYAGCYTVCQEWFDLGRLDSLFVLLVLVAIYASRRWHPIVAAVIWVLAFQTKQSILPVAVVVLCCNWREARRLLAGLAVFAAGAAGSVAWLNHATQGWYSFYVFAVPKANADLKPLAAAMFWPYDMIRPLALTLAIILAAVLFTRPSLRSPATRVYLGACSLIPVFWLVRAHAGSTENALMPVYALVAVLFGISLGRLMEWLPALEPRLARTALLLLLLAVVGQECAGIYNPGDYRPPDVVTAGNAAVVAEVKSLPGEVYVVEHPYYGWLAGKPVKADLTSIHDAMRPANPEVRSELRGELNEALLRQRFTSILLDFPGATGGIDAAAGETAWRAGYGRALMIPNTQPYTRPEWRIARCGPEPEVEASCLP